MSHDRRGHRDGPREPGRDAGREPGRDSGPGSGAVYLVTREACRTIDRLAAGEFAMPSMVLMENAARHAADIALEMVEPIDEPSVVIVCGPGNNGGDGLAMARHLSNAGCDVRCVLTHPPVDFRGDAALQLEIVRRMKIVCTNDMTQIGARGADLVVDAVLGTGLDREIAGAALAAVVEINRAGERGSRVLAVDVPTGLDCDRGVALGAAVRANVTVSFVGIKAGFAELSAQEFVGDVVVADIGAPRELIERFGTPITRPTGNDARADRPTRRGTRRGRA
ncbi:MAG: NAD(P)H-hydrate epimerase [Phycisphaerae bacterium]|nr:NAD(P)H-hydrate epimerase [Phycisphaerae bacterium]